MRWKGMSMWWVNTQNRFTERSTARAANINYYDLKNYARSYELYVKLQSIATFDKQTGKFNWFNAHHFLPEKIPGMSG